MAALIQSSEWLEGISAGELDAPTPRDESRPAPEPSFVHRHDTARHDVGSDTVSDTRPGAPPSGPVDLATLRRRLTTGRELIRRRAAEDRPPPLPTALPELDRLLGGGLARGELVELTGGRSCGRFSILLATLTGAADAGESAALIDLGDGLQPMDLLAAGARLDRLLWLRPRSVKQALAGAEMLLTGGFPLVIVDLGLPPVPGGRGPAAAWLRLARTAERHGGALLVSSPYRVSGTAAATVLTADGRRLFGRATGPGGAQPLVRGLDTALHLEKTRRRPATPEERLRLLTADTLAYRSLPGEDQEHAPEPTRSPRWRRVTRAGGRFSDEPGEEHVAIRGAAERPRLAAGASGA